MKIRIFLVMFFVLAALLIISNNNLALYSQDNREMFSDLYVAWLDDVFSNIWTVTGNVADLDWMPT